MGTRRAQPFHSALIKLPAHLFCLPTYRTLRWVQGGDRNHGLTTTIRRLLSQSSSQTPLAHSQYAKNGKALTMPRKERAQFVGAHSCPNVAARLPTYWLSSPGRISAGHLLLRLALTAATHQIRRRRDDHSVWCVRAYEEGRSVVSDPVRELTDPAVQRIEKNQAAYTRADAAPVEDRQGRSKSP